MDYHAPETAEQNNVNEQAAPNAVDEPSSRQTIEEATTKAAPAQEESGVQQAQQVQDGLPQNQGQHEQQQEPPQQLAVGVEHQVSHVPPDGAQPMDHTMGGVMQHFDPAALIGVPPGLTPLQQGELPDSGKFKPIDLESLSPKSRQRVMRNRQAATRSKAKKKQQYQLLKDRKAALAAEIEQMEAQLAATQQRVGQLHADNKTLLSSCKCSKE